MPYLKFAFIFIVPLIFFKCTNLEISEQVTSPGNATNIVKPGNQMFTMGTNETTAPLDERPAMTVSLTYDFYMDSVEVTQSEFNSLLLRNPVADSSKYGIGPNYPVYNVSWFDAVLFCNARSKSDTLDTVYSYFEMKRGSNGSVYDLIGLSTNYNSDGYRLPTEAEWEYCAGSDLKNDSLKTAAWFQENSLGKTHPVGTKTPNKLRIYDLIGNVFEWTNDWKDFHKAATLQNPLGARNPNHEFEKVIKGGSFKDGLQYLRTSCRATTYPTTASAAAEYIGFRCARGKIPYGKYVATDSSATISSPVLITYSDMSQLVGTTLAKVVFVNVSGANRRLCFVNYADVHPQVYEFTDRNDVYAPTISPDGRFVAFCTSDEGLRNVTGTVYIRSLEKPELPPVKLPVSEAYVPRWYVDPNTSDTNIIYTNSAIDNNLVEWNSTRTLGQKISGGLPVGAPITIIENGSYHDGISSNGDYMVTGNTILRINHLSSNKRSVLFTSPLNGKPSTESSQVCNVSICPGLNYNAYSMFLDFGCNAINSLVNEAYQPHQYIFISDPVGNIVKSFKNPPAESCWENPEWTNQEQYAVSSSVNKEGQKKNIYVIDLIQEKYQQILSGSSLVQPYFWISDSKLSADDSLGRYDLPPVYRTALNCRMRGFWKHHAEMEYLFIGSSHTGHSIDITEFSKPVYNMGAAGNYYAATKTILMQYVRNHCSNLKFIGIDLFLDGMFFSTDDPLSNNYGYSYDKHNNFWIDSIPSKFIEQLNKNPLSLGPLFDTMSCQNTECNGWGTYIENDKITTKFDNDYAKNFAILKEICDTFATKKIHILFYITPECALYAGKPLFGPGGPTRAIADSVISEVKTMLSSSPYLHFYDANKNGLHDYSNNEFTDGTHLCPTGAKKFSKRIDSLLIEIVKP